MIHLGAVAPILENFLYAIALFRKKEQKTMLEGKDLVLRLTAYQRKEGAFPDAIHLLYHGGFSWKKNVWIAATLHLILTEFDRVIDKGSKEVMQKSLARLLESLATVALPVDLQIILDVILGKKVFVPEQLNLASAIHLVVAHQLADSAIRNAIEKQLEKVIFPDLHLYQGPFEGIKQYRGVPVKTLLEISLLREEQLKEIEMKGADEAILDQTWMESPLTADLSHLKGEAHWVRHRAAGEAGDLITRAFLDTRKGFSAALICSHEISFNQKTSLYLIDLEGLYEEDVYEISLFLNLDPTIQVTLDGATSTIFREGERVKVKSEEKEFELWFRVAEGEGTFIGHISLDSKPYEMEKGGLYDRKISIRTVERSLKCTLELFVGF